MNITGEIGPLAEALAKAQGALSASEKGRKSDGPTKHKYSTLDDVWDACRAPLADNGLSVSQGLRSEVHIVDGEFWGWLVHITTTLLHSSGGSIQETLTLPASQQKGISMTQSIGVAATYGRRYGLCAMVGITQDDDDGKEGPRQKQREKERKADERVHAKMERERLKADKAAADAKRKEGHHKSWTQNERSGFMARLKDAGWGGDYDALKAELERAKQSPPSTWPQVRRNSLLDAIAAKTWPKEASRG